MRIFRKIFEFFGVYPKILATNLSNIWWYLRDYLRFKADNPKDFPFKKPLPVLNERNVESGRLSGHYFHQDLIVAQDIFKSNPEKHVDIGSRTDGFVTHVASFREIEVLDIRPSDKPVKNIVFKESDLMIWNESLAHYTDSLSCLHVIEHFGLGRYGDTIDPKGHEKGWENLYKILIPGGIFYFSTPIGPQRIEFNAHRVFSLRYLIDWINEKYEILNFSYIDDAGDLHFDIKLTDDAITTNAGCWFGCGVFKLKKII